MSAVVAVVLVVMLAVPQLRKFLSIQVAQDIDFQKTVRISVPENAPPGEHTFQVTVQDNEFGDLLAASEPITIVVEDTSGGDDGGGGGGGNGGGGGGGDPGIGGGHRPSAPVRTFAFAPERGHEIKGNSASVTEDAGRVVVKLGSNSDLLWKSLKVPVGNYWLYFDAKHSLPKPVKVAVYVNDKAWKVVTLDNGDNQYRVHRAGLLRVFKGSKVSFRLVNDGSGANDRNFFIDAWALSTSPNLKAIGAPAGKGIIRGTRTRGLRLLPRLNQITREELGKEFVVWDVWSYYAPRLVAHPSRREAIGTEQRLREVMRFWKLVSPDRPRGGAS
jgi:hypothetical protein